MAEGDGRTRVTLTAVRELVAAQFPEWAALEVRPVPAQGHDNTTFRLGDALAVKFPTAEQYSSHAPVERECLAALAGRTTVPIPEHVATGAPGAGYAWPWDVYTWVPETSANRVAAGGEVAFAEDLAAFLRSLWAAPAAGGPPAGEHNFHRGGDLAVYDAQARGAFGEIAGDFDQAAATATWEQGLARPWERSPVWVHGDFAPGNLLLDGGRLSGVIDFGSAAVGDPACDLAIAWTYLRGDARTAFRDAVGADGATWARARAWTLWKAAILTWWRGGSDDYSVAQAPRILADVLADPIGAE